MVTMRIAQGRALAGAGALHCRNYRIDPIPVAEAPAKYCRRVGLQLKRPHRRGQPAKRRTSGDASAAASNSRWKKARMHSNHASVISRRRDRALLGRGRAAARDANKNWREEDVASNGARARRRAAGRATSTDAILRGGVPWPGPRARLPWTHRNINSGPTMRRAPNRRGRRNTFAYSGPSTFWKK